MSIFNNDNRFTPIGSYISTSIEDIHHGMVLNNVFIDRRNNTAMEMDAYSAYLFLKAQGEHTLNSRKQIVERLEIQREKCGGFWTHGAWTGENSEIHLRFTSAAIRLLVEAHCDGLYPNKENLLSIIEKHLSFSEELNIGLWLLHDTIEIPGIGLTLKDSPYVNHVWGSSSENCLVLNTHIDTLITLLDAIERVKFDPLTKEKLLSIAQNAITTLMTVLNDNNSMGWRMFSMVDSAIRSFMFNVQNTKNRILNYIKWRVIDYYYTFRRVLKARYQCFIFKDGYLERDISLQGYFFFYHVFNLHDLSRFQLIATRLGVLNPQQSQKLINIIDNAIEYCCNSAYIKIIRDSYTQDGRAGVLAEAMLARASMTKNFTLPEKWSVMLAEILHKVAPTPALAGYDPFIIKGVTHSNSRLSYRLLNGDILDLSTIIEQKK